MTGDSETDFDHIDYNSDTDIATLHMNRPEKKNAINERMRDEIQSALNSFAKNEAKVLVLTGTDDTFSAGADIGDLENRIPETTTESLQMESYSLPDHIEALDKPVIAMINGTAVGGGLELALACDIRFTTPDTKLGFPEIGLGGIPGEGGTQRLSRETNVGTAMLLILTGELINGERAYKEGIVQRTHPESELEEKTMATAEMMAEKEQTALLLAKRAVLLADRTDFQEGVELTGLFANLIETTPGRKEQLREFLQE